MNITARAVELNFCCGVTEVGSFRSDSDSWSASLEDEIKENESYVFKIATFTNTPQCKKAYEIMCNKLKLVSQTEPKRNPNSGNLVIVCVFTNKAK